MLNEIAMNSLHKVSSTLKSIYNLRLHNIHKFKSKINIHIEMGPYILKTVSDISELKEALALRYEIFHREMLGSKISFGYDIDEFDAFSDHLIIKDKRSNQTIGTYRLNCSTYTDQFYSGKEFNLSRVLEQPGIKLELGRACIRKDYRRGIAVSLLWKGIAEYMNHSKANILFGCASIKTSSPREAALLYRYFFETKRFTPEYLATPSKAFSMPHLDLWISNFDSGLKEEEKTKALSLIPPLFRAYLKIGAYVGGTPAWDSEFKCIDFLTILNKEDLNRSLWKKYKLDSEF
ncbi:MAG: GNAT family N-acetyltransferase [Bdellovibrionales bacterium]|nr:GNAT family N-acetyltransferase [Bdellovibrionales bacterium]